MSRQGEPSSRRVADAVAASLHGAGVRHAFGMPGGEIVAFLDALNQSGIRFVLMRHETPAAIAAGATHLVTQAPGLLVTTLGPGLANAFNGIADAVQERTPLLVISAVVERRHRGRYTHQIVSHRALLGGLVKASFELDRFDPAATVRRAVRLAMTPPMGPVHLDLAPDVAAALVEERDGGRANPAIAVAATPNPDDPRLVDIRDRLAASARPLVLAGYDVARSGAAPDLVRLATALTLPVITTYKGKGVVDEQADVALGAAGLSPLADTFLLPLVRQADLILLIGYDPIEMRPGWLDPFSSDATVIDLGLAPVDHAMHQADIAVTGALPGLLSALLTRSVRPQAGALRKAWIEGPVAAARDALRKAFAPPDRWGPHAVFETLQNTIPDDAVLTVDSGAHRILLSQMWRSLRPLSLLQSAGWCTMGAALPLAIGSKIAEPARPVVAVMGDGGLEMVMGELATLRDHGLALTVVVLQDESLALIELKQRQAGFERLGVGLGTTDLAMAARAFGGDGVLVRDSRHLAEALRAAFARREGFSLIACAVQADDYVGAF